MGIPSIETGVFGGIVVGLLAAAIFNRFYKIQLPSYLGFFAGKRAVPIITAFAVVPTAYVMIAGLLRNMDPQLEQAARVHGGRGWTIIRFVTLPLLVPGLVSIGIYMFMSVVQTFDLPLIIGLTARFRFLFQNPQVVDRGGGLIADAL